MASINETSALFRAIVDESYAEGVHDGLRIAADLAREKQNKGEDVGDAVIGALAYFEENRP